MAGSHGPESPPLLSLRLLYADQKSSSSSSSTSVYAGHLYRLSLPRAADFAAVDAVRTARFLLAEWSPAESKPALSARSARSFDELGVCIFVAAAPGNPHAYAHVPAATQGAADVRIGPDGNALDLVWFQITSAERYDGRPLALVGTWADGSPLPGVDGMCIRVEASSGGKRPISADELRSGAFLGVAKRLQVVPPPLTPPVPPPGTLPAAGLFDSDKLTAAALRAETAVRSPLSTPVSTPPSVLGSTLRQSEPTRPQSSPPLPGSADSDLDLERELEALHIAKNIAGEDEHAEIKPQELASLAMAIGERKDAIRNIVRRTIDELVLRGQRSGNNHPSLASLTRLAKVLSQLDAAGLENPTPPPPSHTLFAMDVLEQPDIARWGEPLPGWFPPSEYGEKYVASVEHEFQGRAAGGPPTVSAVNSATARLADDRLLLSPLVRTFAGRIRFRALLVILREAAVSMAPVTRIANHLTTAALRRLSARSEDGEDAVRSAWDAVEALRPVLRDSAPDLYPITVTRALEVLKLASDTANSLRNRARPVAVAATTLLYAEAIARIGQQEAMAGLLQDGIDHLFEAWALLLRAGASPSRLESRIILSLTEAHLISPTACQLAERVYWCKESEEDLHIEARACCVLAHLSGAAGRAEEAKRYADRVFEILENVPLAHRDCEAVSFVAASISIMASVRTGRVDECFLYSRLARDERNKHSDDAHPALDSANGGFRLYQGPAMEGCLEMFRFGLFLYALADPHELTSVHLTGPISAMGEIYVRQGQWKRAAMCYTEALEQSKPFRKVFPLDHPRVVRLTAALKQCEKLLLPTPPLPSGKAG